MIALRKITKENYEECFHLKSCRQSDGLCTIQYILAGPGLGFRDTSYPLAIYADTTLVGFIMLGYYEVKNYFTVWRFMIDEKYQNKGYGKEALTLKH